MQVRFIFTSVSSDCHGNADVKARWALQHRLIIQIIRRSLLKCSTCSINGVNGVLIADPNISLYISLSYIFNELLDV